MFSKAQCLLVHTLVVDKLEKQGALLCQHPAHAVTLSTSSQSFKAQLSQAWQHAGGAAGDSSTGSQGSTVSLYVKERPVTVHLRKDQIEASQGESSLAPFDAVILYCHPVQSLATVPPGQASCRRGLLRCCLCAAVTATLCGPRRLMQHGRWSDWSPRSSPRLPAG